MDEWYIPIHAVHVAEFSNAEARCEGALFHLIRNLDTIAEGVTPGGRVSPDLVPSMSTFPWAKAGRKMAFV